MISPTSWIACQLGAREHYAVPRILHGAGRLDALYTDFWAGALARRLASVTGSRTLRSLGGRFHPDLDKARVFSWNARSLIWEAKVKFSQKSGAPDDRFRDYAKIGGQFGGAVRDSLRKRKGLLQGIVLFAYDTAALELLEWCREAGIRTVVNQMDPNRVEFELVQNEEKIWPGWALQKMEIPHEYCERRKKEWELADRVVVNSEFSLQAVVKQGLPIEKVTVMPLCYQPPEDVSMQAARKRCGPLRVLWLGQVILRKGIQYLVEAARLLKGGDFRLDIVGPIGISSEAVSSSPSNMFFHGPVSRDRVPEWYRRADVFVLPTLSDGFAITQLEAMANGLPVVTTPCCGNVVTSGKDGIVIPPRDPASLAKALTSYLENSEMLESHGMAALRKAREFSSGKLAAGLWQLEKSLRSGQKV